MGGPPLPETLIHTRMTQQIANMVVTKEDKCVSRNNGCDKKLI
jgi:hypothetical protein